MAAKLLKCAKNLTVALHMEHEDDERGRMFLAAMYCEIITPGLEGTKNDLLMHACLIKLINNYLLCPLAR